MEPHNVLADQVQVGGPVARKITVDVGIADCCHIRGQRIDPHIHDMIGRSRHFHAPVKAGPRDAEVAQATLDKADHFVAAAIGTDEVGLVGIKSEQPVLIVRQAEEPAFLDGPFDRRSLWRQARAALPVGQFLFLVIRLVTDRIPTLVAVEIQVPICLHRFPDRD